MLLFGLVVGAVLGYFVVQMLASIILSIDDYYFLVTLTILSTISITFISATLIPAYRTLQMEPNNALRYE